MVYCYDILLRHTTESSIRGGSRQSNMHAFVAKYWVHSLHHVRNILARFDDKFNEDHTRRDLLYATVLIGGLSVSHKEKMTAY